MGKVSQPHCSGVLTTSFVISLQDLQTEAQATTSLRPGHEVSLASTRWIISWSNSGGKFAHGLCSTTPMGSQGNSDPPSGAIWARPRWCVRFLCNFPMDILPMSSRISFSSRTKLLNDISRTSKAILRNLRTQQWTAKQSLREKNNKNKWECNNTLKMEK